MRFHDDSAQWLLLSAVVISIGLGALVLLLNNAVLSGHSSTQSITSFPKDELRDLRSNSISEVLILGENINKNVTTNNKDDIFNADFARYKNEMFNMSLIDGAIIDITAVPEVYDLSASNTVITNVTLSLWYNNSNTAYTEKVVLGIPG